MKVLALSTYDFDGGASRAAFRLHQGLLSAGVDSAMLVKGKFSTDSRVTGPKGKLAKGLSMLRPELDALPLKIYPGRQPTPWSLSWLPNNLMPQIDAVGPDLIHLHWVGFGFVPTASLRNFRKPLVWTLHDMWPFTGGCHYAGECTRYREECGSCPQLGSARDWDLSRWVMSRKLKQWQDLDLTIVTPSRWLADCARSSRLFARRRIEVIPNGLDLAVYKPVDKLLARKLLNLPVDRQLVLTGAINVSGEPRKGLEILLAAINGMQEPVSRTFELLVVGSGEPANKQFSQVKTHYLGRWHDDAGIALLLAAADLFVLPSTQDNLPNTIMEAMACGTPCIAFNLGGMPDMITHGENGYLAEPCQPADLARGIAWALADDSKLVELSRKAREKVTADFSLDHVARRYQRLYREVLQHAATDPAP
jgi:glycosyltransferase involved in cell wall biosynthesis